MTKDEFTELCDRAWKRGHGEIEQLRLTEGDLNELMSQLTDHWVPGPLGEGKQLAVINPVTRSRIPVRIAQAYSVVVVQQSVRSYLE